MHITGQRAHGGPQISIQATEGTFPYVTLFLRDYEALEKLRDVCQSLLSGAWVAS